MEEAEKPKSPSPQAGDKYIVRFPEGMRERIAEAARGNNRSMNAEILARMESSFNPGEPYATKSQLERVLKKMAEERKTAEFMQVAIRDLLAGYVVNLYDSLPINSQARTSFAVARGFANSLKSEKAEDLEEWLDKAIPFKGDKEIIKGVASLLRYANKVREELKNEEEAPKE